VLLPFALPQAATRRAELARELPWLATFGVVGIAAFNCFVYAALHYTTVVNGALINALTPVMTFLIALAMLDEPMPPRRLLGLALSLAGALAIISRGEAAALADLTFNRGDVLVLIGSAFWALYTVLLRWRPTRLPPILFLAATIGFGALVHLPLLAWEMTTAGVFVLDARTAAALLYLGIFPSVLAYILWNRAVVVLGPSRTAMYLYLMPVFAALLAIVFLGETFYAYHALGILLIFAGIALVTRTPARPTAA
jgi:drug/metabolite transporter (DMT)-like permease